MNNGRIFVALSFCPLGRGQSLKFIHLLQVDTARNYDVNTPNLICNLSGYCFWELSYFTTPPVVAISVKLSFCYMAVALRGLFHGMCLR